MHYTPSRQTVLSFLVPPLAPTLAYLVFLFVIYRGMDGSLTSIIGAARFSLLFIYPICLLVLIFGGVPILAFKTPRKYQPVMFMGGATLAVSLLFLAGVLNTSQALPSAIFLTFALATMYSIFIHMAGIKLHA